VPDALIGGFQQIGLLSRGAKRRLAVSRSYSTEEPSETGERPRGHGGHARRQEQEEDRERNELREGAKAPEQPPSEARLDVASSLGERKHGSGRGRSMIILSRLAQPVSRQQGVEKVQPNGTTYLGGDAGLNVGGVSARSRFQGDNGQPHE
jgi:hypothetical protein